VRIPREYQGLTPKIIDSLKVNRFQSVEDLSKALDINRTWLAGYLAALETQGMIGCRKVGRAKIYFRKSSEE